MSSHEYAMKDLQLSMPKIPSKSELQIIRRLDLLQIYENRLLILLLWEYSGVLACLDGYMNIAMEQTEEYVNGDLKNKYGDCFIRGNNGTSRKPFFVLYVCAVMPLHGFCL